MLSARSLQVIDRLPAFLRSPVYKSLYRRHGPSYQVKAAGFAGRHVLVLGPADSALDDLLGLGKRHYDDVVRFNNGLDTPVAVPGMDPLRCDVLFHSLKSDARPVTAPALQRAGVRLLIHRTPKQSNFLTTLRAEATMARSAGCRIGILPVAEYDRMEKSLQGAAPTSGFACLDFLLRAPLASLTVVGFSFFTTRYMPGYDDRFTTDLEAQERVATEGHHDPNREALLLSRRFEDARDAGLDLRLGAQVTAALAAASAPASPVP